MQRSTALLKANIIVFISSFCVMVIELIAARMMAPSIGVSLYTWTSIIGVILAGIALGNFTGGKIADKYPSPLVLAWIFFLGSLLTIAIMPLANMLSAHGDWFVNWPLMLNFTLRTLIIFFIPAFVLSMVSPTMIKLALADLGKTGGTVGAIYAVSTAGSILGTFMTGFYFILWFGTRMIVWIVAGVLLLTGIIVLISWKATTGERRLFRIISWALALLIVACGAVYYFTFPDSWRVSYFKESNYYTINVYEEPGNVKVLALDRLVHSYVVPDNPLLLKYDYLKIFTEVIGYGSGDNDTPRILHMGGGGYSLPRYLETVNPQSINEVVEIDPAVTKTAYEKLGLPSDMAIKTYNQDARLFLMQQQTQDKYNFIVGDVFNDFSTPYHLTTVEFNRVISSRMQPDGIYMINIIDDFKEGKFMPSMVYTLKQVFQNVIILSVSNDWVNAGLSTYVIIATDRSFDEADYRKSASDDGKNTAVGYAFWGSDLDRYLEERNPVLLSDDYVPTDIMVAEMLKKR